ncbi:MAG: hypothetical protein JXR95_04260 [Deltaproteobacteria bacterium]|nr:hypothetical protein [Deltaproteobacteria bacterium]
MSKRKIAAIISAVAGVLILVSVFSNTLLTKSGPRGSVKMGYTSMEACRGDNCRTTDIKKLEKDLAPIAHGLKYLVILIGILGLIVPARRFLAQPDTETQKSLDKYQLFFLIFSVLGLLILLGWIFVMPNMHGIIRLKLEIGWGAIIGIIGYVISIGAFILMKLDRE